MLINRRVLYKGIRSTTGRLTKQQVASIEAILTSLEKHNISAKYCAYILATAYHESSFRPVRETFGKSNKQVISRLNSYYKSKVGTNRCYWCPDNKNKSWYGRGFVQLTWKRNYEKLGRRLGIDLVSNPDVVLKSSIAADILVIGMTEGLFTGKSVYNYKSFRQMRRVVNGLDKSSVFAKTAQEYLKHVTTAQGTNDSDLIKNSRKLTLMQRIKGFVVLSVPTLLSLFTLDTFELASGFIGDLTIMMKSNSVLIVAGMLIFGWLVANYVKKTTIEDYNVGRYDPSGEK